MAFQRFVHKSRQGRPPAPYSFLEVGEICFLPEPSSRKLRSRVWQTEYRTGKKFEYQECKNGGIIIRRCL